jgi:hypothetical protein
MNKPKIGDELICSNGITYTLEQGDEDWEFSIVKDGIYEVNRLKEIAVVKSVYFKKPICVGINFWADQETDDYFIYTYVIKHVSK